MNNNNMITYTYLYAAAGVAATDCILTARCCPAAGCCLSSLGTAVAAVVDPCEASEPLLPLPVPHPHPLD